MSSWVKMFSIYYYIQLGQDVQYILLHLAGFHVEQSERVNTSSETTAPAVWQAASDRMGHHRGTCLEAVTVVTALLDERETAERRNQSLVRVIQQVAKKTVCERENERAKSFLVHMPVLRKSSLVCVFSCDLSLNVDMFYVQVWPMSFTRMTQDFLEVHVLSLPLVSATVMHFLSGQEEKLRVGIL